ncbi:Beta-barrel assembly-enhancing protease [Andreprevotia sp. IGB-42]|uniref:tetratricopeptide repeat protein n=1 Tax=Andreprevotia sp. IGB-42 TaxID=2497473 RepID=UPI0013575BB0|nr:tetratricopeptide repeat protein [Andreprevotia sp. IGB-42]KAF0813384.1 Beta-barrel assembly-enhancing protease [Andreprevotia sp. IGB-42]
MTPESEKIARHLGYLRQDPDNINLLLDVVKLQLAEGQQPEAETLLDEGLARWPAHAALMYERALLALSQNDEATAKVLFQNLLETGQATPALRYNLAYAHYASSEFQQCLDQLLQLPENERGDIPYAACLQILALHQLGELAQARSYAELRLATAPDNAEVAGLLALVCLDDNDLEGARHWSELSLASQPEQVYAQVVQGTLEIPENPAAASARFEQLLGNRPRDGRAWSGLAIASFSLRDMTKAAAAFEQAVMFMPGHIGTWHAYGWLHLIEGRLSEAENCFQQALDLDRNFGESYGGMAVVATMQGRTADAEALLKRAYRLAPEGLSAQFIALLQAKSSGNQHEVEQVVQRAFATLNASNPEQIQQIVRNALLSNGSYKH